jgi:AcrR family transcriptional regulator
VTPTANPSRPGDATVRPGLRERKKARTREAIQQHALRLFRDQGYAETTVEEIAAAAEISPSTFFRYFPTKGDAVLAEFIDGRIFEMLAEAPAGLDLVSALRFALRTAFADMTDEQVALEMQRNALIASVPELQRGLMEELVRPIRLLAEAFALRLGTTPDDPTTLGYAGAVVGAMLAIAGPLDGHLDPEYDYRERLEPALDMLDQILIRRGPAPA